ncbi:hypothetical protein N9Q00_00415 [Amylibacter sp.]|nr:hypothetical protein [Amylibacter sp.]MDB9785464.1 hypothetical protein [Amylibacter sp.]
MKPEEVKIQDTYPQLLRTKFGYDTYHQGQGFATVAVIRSYLNYFNIDDYDKIILQFGIVDCAPRPLTRYEYFILRNIKLNKGLDFFMRKYRNIKKTKLHIFERYCIDIKELCRDKLLVLPIVYASSDYEEELPNIGNNVNRYNEILKSIFGKHLVDLELEEEHFMTDQHHFSKIGHKKIASILNSKVP